MYTLAFFLFLFSFSASDKPAQYVPEFQYKTDFIDVNGKKRETCMVGKGRLKKCVFRTLFQNCQVITCNRANYKYSSSEPNHIQHSA